MKLDSKLACMVSFPCTDSSLNCWIGVRLPVRPYSQLMGSDVEDIHKVNQTLLRKLFLTV